MKNKIITLGISISIIGIVWLVVNVMELNVDLSYIVPALVCFVGVGIIAYYFAFNRQNWAQLIGGVFLTLVGLVVEGSVLADNFFGIAGIWSFTIFMYPGSLAIALWVGWVASGKKVRLLIAALMLTFISVLVFCFVMVTGIFGNFLGVDTVDRLVAIFWPLMLILSGLLIVIMPFIKDLMDKGEISIEVKAEQNPESMVE